MGKQSGNQVQQQNVLNRNVMLVRFYHLYLPNILSNYLIFYQIKSNRDETEVSLRSMLFVASTISILLFAHHSIYFLLNQINHKLPKPQKARGIA